GEQLDYKKLKDKDGARLIDYFFDFNKADEEVDIADLKNVAEAHGGKLLTQDFKTGDMYAKLQWENQDREVFTATAYSVLRAGHWVNKTYAENVWEFDRLSKKDKLYAQLWYDSHEKDENNFYGLDKDFNAGLRKEI
ncbi:MAG: NAD(P)-dependent oxidoreductase, partial [Clostridia bacterium]|nr:NAD(P)-dependent oxidoreductase [Clostridia bacterium]